MSRPCCVREHCVAPTLCFQPPLGDAERFEIKLDAEAAARRFAAHNVKQPNPWPRATRRYVFWASYYLEHLVDIEDAATPAP